MLVACSDFLVDNVAFQFTTDSRTVWQPEWQTLSNLLWNHEEVKFFTKFTVVTFFGFFTHLKVVLQVFLVKPSCTIDPLHHSVVAISTPVSTCYMEKVEDLDATSWWDVRSTAEVHVFTLTVDSQTTFVFRVFFDQFQLVRVVLKDFTCLVFGNFLANRWEVFLDDLLHFFFDTRKVFVRDLTSCVVRIVVETIFDSWTNPQVNIWEKTTSCLSKQVSSWMAQDWKGIFVIRCHDFDGTIFGDSTSRVDEFAVEFTCQGFFR